MGIEEIKQMLLVNHNIILHGAPGTGKTYLAKEVARALGATEGNRRFKMIQFHSSYDYTDFVEGLRPTGTDKNGNIIFARQDGVFKTFCKKAIPHSTPSYEYVFSILYDKIKNGDITSYKILKEYGLRVDDNNIQYEVAQGWRNYKYLKTLYNYYITHDDIDINNINADDINKIIGDDTEIKANSADYGPHKWAIQQLIRIAENLKNDCRSKNIFLIDEINRGDMSKIFGELFYAIDPGYRGVDGKIDTQYQNLIDKQGNDPFKDGFYVPENVYIIGTMNDIDRSVESMDFAMRRRFQFIEVTAEDRAYGMGLKKDENPKAEADYKTKDAYARMTNLNNCIISKEIGLSKAYQIGGSYFLKEKIEDGKKISVPITSDDEFKNLWDYRLKGLLREYLRGEEDKVIEEKLENILKPAFNLQSGHLYNPKVERANNKQSATLENTTTDE